MDIELAQALKEIAELKAQIERNKIDLAISEHDREHNDYELTEVYKKVEQLEKENAELKSELHRVSLNEQLAINNGKNFLGQIAELEKENVELKARVSEQSERISELTQELDDKINCLG